LLAYLFEANTSGWRFIYLTGRIGVFEKVVLDIFKESLELTDLLSDATVLTDEFFN
jgi:hypothetical protein